MNKSDYTGWREVFRFSFEQSIKAKSYLVSLVIFSLITFLAMPIMGFIQGRGETGLGATEVAQLLVYDETGLNVDFSGFCNGERYEALVIQTAPEQSFEESVTKLENTSDSCDVLLRIQYEQQMGCFQLNFVKPAKAGFSEKDYKALTEDFGLYFEEAKRKAIEVTAEQYAFINQPVASVVEFVNVDESGTVSIAPKDKTEGISMQEYGVLLTGIIVVMMVINLSGGQIANSIVTEKATRVVEYLMINVRPMALIVGKILASLLLVVIQMGAVGVAFLLGKTVSGYLFDTAQTGDTESSISFFLERLSEITATRLMICIVVILIGVLFFCILAGLAGASVSKLDELAEGMKIYQMMMILGSYAGIGVCVMQMIGGVNPMVLNVLCMIPISAPFILPMNMLMGKIDIWVGFISLGLLFLMTAALFSFTAKVYESMIFYNGSVLKLKDIIQIAKNRRVEKGEKK